jgi:serine kinase of HPr protein (carbohydrate metabolism regulator)
MRCGIQWKKFVSLIVSHNRKNFFRCILQQRKTFSVVSHNARNAAVLYPTVAKKQNLNIFTTIIFSAK